MQIAVRGARVDEEEWEAAQALPAGKLPITQALRETAQALHVGIEDYARGAYAESLSQDRLLRETERFAEWLDREVRAKFPGASVEAVKFDAFKEKYQAVVARGNHRMPVRIDEAVVTSLFESGSADAQDRLSRILELNLSVRVA
jgi:hypothetical protein